MVLEDRPAREGAALQLGGSLAELVRKGGKLGAEFQDLAIMCGMSAGFSAVFGSQITAALFALEISCVGILPLGGLFPCVVSSLAAGTVARAMGVRAMRFYLSASTPDVLFYGQVLVLGIGLRPAEYFGLLYLFRCPGGAGAAVSQPLSPGGGGERRCHGSHLNFWAQKPIWGQGRPSLPRPLTRGGRRPRIAFLNCC